MSLHTAGNAVNAATALAQLGMPVEIIGKVAFDPFGDFLLRELDDRHIGTCGISRDLEMGTSATMVMVGADGERRCVYYIGTSARLAPDDVDFPARGGVAGPAWH